MTNEKRCSRCKEVKPLTGFGNCKSYTDGLARYCKACKKAYDASPARRDWRIAYRKDPKRLANDPVPTGMKRCRFGCKEILPVDRFGKCKTYADGLNETCKECLRKRRSTPDSRMAISKNNAKYRQTELGKKRAKKGNRKYLSTEKGKISSRRGTSKHKKKYPEKNRARVAVGLAVIDGRLERKGCEVCGSENSQGHHDDYSKPLEVRWLCPQHHRDAHRRLEAIGHDFHA